jgi:prepilin-type N-terminal cleavage/methylation domain-containing protein
MIRLKSKIADNSGFTLVEIIVSLVVAGILSIFYFHFMGTAMDHSWKSVELAAGESKSEGLMEKIIAEYVELINQPPQAPPNDALTLIKLRESTYESDPDYGSPVTMEYIGYDSAGNESPVPSPGTSNNLKVTVQAPGNDFTTILTKSRNEATDPIVFY